MGVSSRNENSFVSRRVHEDAESLLVVDPKNADIKNLVDVVQNLKNLRGKPSSLEASGLVVHKYVCESAVGLKVVGHAEQIMKSRLDELTFSEVVAGLEERKEKLEVSGLFCQGSELVPNAFCNADVVKFVSSAHDLLRDLEKKRKRNSNACPYGLLFLQTQGILDMFGNVCRKASRVCMQRSLTDSAIEHSMLCRTMVLLPMAQSCVCKHGKSACQWPHVWMRMP